jgi:uncharacterized membrane protein YdjX (TVP38/TMEM64 family)
MMPLRKRNDVVTEVTDRINWWKLAATIALLIGISFGLAYLFQSVSKKLPLPLFDYAWLAYLVVFLVSLVSNLTIIAPVPFALSILIAASTKWNPVLIALFASIGASIGELSAYYAGRLGRKIAIPESAVWHSRFERWIKRYGFWAIFVLAFQPILPFDIAGLIAGAARMPLRIFFPALWLGRFPKYLIFALIGAGLISHLPFISITG